MEWLQEVSLLQLGGDNAHLSFPFRKFVWRIVFLPTIFHRLPLSKICFGIG
jgi:hypothetical protein